jgi:ABC-type Fe3+ transport system permease subunit
MSLRALSRPTATSLRMWRASGPPMGLLLPALAVAALAALPLVYLVVRALGVDASALGLVLRPRTLEIVLASAALGVGVAIGSIALGLPLAWLTARTDLPGRRLWTILTVVPLAVPSYVMAFAFVAALGPRGAASELLVSIGLPALPSIYGFGGAVLVITLATYPYVLLGTRAALMRFDPAIEEAGRALGDRPMRVFRRLTLPLLVPAIAAGALLAVLYALADFGAVAIMQFDSFARAIYIQYRSSFDRSLAALVAVLMALPVALIAVRHTGRLQAWIERILYSAFAMPGIVVALAVVVFILNVVPFLYQSLAVLIVAYAVRFLPQAIGPLRTSLTQVSPRVVEAARTLGDSPAGAFRGVTLPLLRPGLMAGLALVFLTTVKELPVTLLLSPIGFDTLATAIWGAAREGFYARAPAPAAMLMLLAGVSVGLLFRSERTPA